MNYQTDYLVIGSGASAMAFVDTMLSQTNATFLMVDRRPNAGGHWNDAYPFVQLHQPASYYGVASRPLGKNELDTTGLNKGHFSLASGVDINHYYQCLMDEVFMPSGRVQHLPLCEYTPNGDIISLMSGEQHNVTVNQKVVDATHLTTSIPMTHTPNFKVADGVTSIPPNFLCTFAPKYKHITVLGGGKTGIDSILWLLTNHYPPANISWVIPRDSWFYDRSNFQPDEAFLEQTLEFTASQLETYASAKSVEDICKGMEEQGNWLRLDKNVWPSMFHAAIITKAELKQMQAISNIIRLGRVESIAPTRITLTNGSVDCQEDTLYVDCTAAGLGYNVNNFTPVFEDKRINLQMIRTWQPCLSSAIIAYIEANIQDPTLRSAMTHPTPMTDTVKDFLKTQACYLMNQGQWQAHEGLAKFLIECRLDGFTRLVAKISPDDHKKMSQLGRAVQNGPLAVQNLLRLSQAS
jgi:hypothetical protein